MSATNLFIPRRINVGFQKRKDTYTGNLAYVIYFDEKGKLRKEASWNSWRDSKIPNIEYENEPTDGFVLNKKVGGYCNHWSDFRQAYVRVYDPRGFEFEITVPNLLYVLENTNCIKGKGLEGKFVYGWDGTDLVLVPCASGDYEQLAKLNDTRFENKRIKAKDLKIGGTYLTKKGEKYVYLGKFDYYGDGYKFDGQFFETCGQMVKYAEANGKEITESTSSRWPYDRVSRYEYADGLCGQRYYFSSLEDLKTVYVKSIPGWLIDTLSEDCICDYAQRMETVEHDPHYSPYDKEKDVKVFYDFDTFMKKLDEGLGCRIFSCERDGATICLVVDACYDGAGNRDGTYVVRNNAYANAFNPQRLFNGKENSAGYWSMYPVEPIEIFNKFKFFYVDQYLQNGKYYRRVFC